MSIEAIEISAAIKSLPNSPGAERLIDRANDAIEAWMLADEVVVESFVTSDYHLLDQALAWISQNDLLTGNRFCELGAGFGVGAMLAEQYGMEATGIEIDPRLVAQSLNLADAIGSQANFYCGNFIPNDSNLVAPKVDPDIDVGADFRLCNFDLMYVYPWPDEREAYEAIFAANSKVGALLLSYHGRTGMKLIRKS